MTTQVSTTLRRLLPLVLGMALAACGGGGGGGQDSGSGGQTLATCAARDGVAARSTLGHDAVCAVYPQTAGADAPVTAHPYVKFSRAMDPQSVPGNFSLVDSGGTPVLGSALYDASRKDLVFTPSQPLSYGEVYTATVGAGTTDLSGTPVAAAFSWSFTTVPGSAAPSVSNGGAIDGSTDVPVSGGIDIVFSEAMDPASLATAISLDDGQDLQVTGRAISGRALVPGTVSYDPATFTATFTPSQPLAYGLTYTLTVSTAARNAQGAPLAAPLSMSFTTEAPPLYLVTLSPVAVPSGYQVVVRLAADANLDATLDDSQTSYVYGQALTAGTAYSVGVLSAPAALDCVLSGPTSSGGINANVTIGVNCAEQFFSVGGTASGLSGAGLQLLDSVSGQVLNISADGGFAFLPLLNGSAYAISVSAQPTGQTCALSGSTSGALAGADVTDLSVSCAVNDYVVSASVSGLQAGDSVDLTIAPSGDNLTLSAAAPNGSFLNTLAHGTSYGVSITSEPPGKDCSLSGNASGLLTQPETVTVSCALEQHAVSADVTGLDTGESLDLVLSPGGEVISIDAATGSGSYSTLLDYGTAYSVSVQAAPTGKTCTLSNAAGTVTGAVLVSAACAWDQFAVDATVTGLGAAEQVQLGISPSGDTLLLDDVTSAGSFPTAMDYGSAYSVSVLSDPPGKTCSLDANASGTLTANVSVAVTCDPDQYPVSATATGLDTFATVTLLLDATADTLTLSQVGPTGSFATPLDHGTAYAVSVDSTTLGTTCTLGGNASGTLTQAEDIAVSCGPTQYFTTVEATGLSGAETLSITKNQGEVDEETVVLDQANGWTAAFADSDDHGYYVILQSGSDPVGKTCTPDSVGFNISSDSTQVFSCAVSQYTVTVDATGQLTTGEQLDLTITPSNDPMSLDDGTTSSAFATPLDHGTGYAVSIVSEPAGKDCTLSANASGTLTQNQTVTVGCTIEQHTVSASASGLSGAESVQVTDGSEVLTLDSGNSWTASFASLVTYGGSATVSVVADPTGHTCTPASDTQTVTSATLISFSCPLNTYTVTAQLGYALDAGQQVQLSLGADLLVLDPDTTSDTFAGTVTHGSAYTVNVDSAPAGRACSLLNGSGTATGNVNVDVRCYPEFAVDLRGSGRTAAVGWDPASVAEAGGSMTAYLSTQAGFDYQDTGAPGWASVSLNSNPEMLSLGSWLTPGTQYYFRLVASLPSGHVHQSAEAAAFVPASRYAYVLNRGGGFGASEATVSVFGLDSASGAFRSLGYTRLSGTIRHLNAAPDNRWMLVSADFGGNEYPAIYSLAMGSDGRLTYTDMLEFVNSETPIAPPVFSRIPGVAYMPLSYLEGRLATVRFDDVTGLFSGYDLFPADSFSVGAVVMHPLYRYLLAGGYDTGTSMPVLRVFSVDSGTGALAVVADVPTAGVGSFDRIAVDPAGRYVYAADSGGMQVQPFDILDPENPVALTPVALAEPVQSLSVDPSGRLVYVRTQSELVKYGISVTGNLVAPVTTAAGTVSDPANMLHQLTGLEITGQYLIDLQAGNLGVLDGQGFVSQGYSLNPVSGDPTAESTLNMRTRGGPSAIVFADGNGPLVFATTFAYTGGTDGSLNQVETLLVDDVTGELTRGFDAGLSSSPATYNDGGGSLISLAVHPSGSYLYGADAAASAQGVRAFTILGNGSLGAIGAADAGVSPQAVAVDPSGRALYTATGSAVVMRSIAAGGGVAASGVSVGNGNFVGVYPDPTGRFVYAGVSASSQLAISAVESFDGSLNGPILGEVNGPVRTVAFHPNGQFLYLADSNMNVESRSIAPLDGTIGTVVDSIMSSGLPGFGANYDPVKLLVDPHGEYVLLLNGNGFLYRFSTAFDGRLVAVDEVDLQIATASAAAVDPYGRYLYVVDADVATPLVWKFDIDATGMPALPGTAVGTVPNPQDIVLLDSPLAAPAGSAVSLNTGRLAADGKGSPASTPAPRGGAGGLDLGVLLLLGALSGLLSASRRRAPRGR